MRFLSLIAAALLLAILAYAGISHRGASGLVPVGTLDPTQGTYLGTGYFDVFDCNGVETYATSSQAAYTQVKNNVQPKMQGCTWVKSYQGDRYNRATLPTVNVSVASST